MARAHADEELKKALSSLSSHDWSINLRAFDRFIDRVKDLFNEEAAKLLDNRNDWSTFKQDLLRLRDKIADEYTAAPSSRKRTKKQKRHDELPMDMDQRLHIGPADKWDLFAPTVFLPNKKYAVREELRAVLGKELSYWLRRADHEFDPYQPANPENVNQERSTLGLTTECLSFDRYNAEQAHSREIDYSKDAAREIPDQRSSLATGTHEEGRALQFGGPDDAVLFICAGGNHYLWQIRNDGLGVMRQVQLEVSAVQSFHSGKGAFREATGFTFRWPIIKELGAGCISKPHIFVRIDDLHLGLWNSTGDNLLPWPSGDLRSARTWRLSLNISGLSKPWTLSIDVHWVIGAKKLSFTHHQVRVNSAAPMENKPDASLVSGQGATTASIDQGESTSSRAALSMVRPEPREDELAEKTKEREMYEPYPKCKYTWGGETAIVNNAAEDAALGPLWANSPDVFAPYLGPRPSKSSGLDSTKWVDHWPMQGWTAEHRNKIKAQLLRADGVFWRMPDSPNAFVEPMRSALIGIIDILANAGILSERLLKYELPALTLEAAIAGGWYRAASETQLAIFQERLGRYWIWRDPKIDWENLFYSEIQEGLARLLEQPTFSHPHDNKSGKTLNPTLASQVPYSPGPEKDATDEGKEQRSAKRNAVVTPILTNKRWSRGRLADKAGLGKNSIYEYLDGTRIKISDQNRKAIADALGIAPEDLPD